MSATVSAIAPAPPESPHLRVEGLHCEGVDVTWTMPQQFGDASVSVSEDIVWVLRCRVCIGLSRYKDKGIVFVVCIVVLGI